MTKDEHSQHALLIKQFLTTLFNKEDRVHIFPCLPKTRLDDVLARRVSLPLGNIHGRDLIYFPSTDRDAGEQWDDQALRQCKDAAVPRRVLKPFARKADSTGTALIPKLNDFVALGYDIFFCANPLTFGNRRKATVSRACHIVLESDDALTPIEAQKAILDTFKDSISAMVFSGNKSVHAFVRLSPPIWNPNPITWNTKYRIHQHERFDWDDYRDAAKYWIQKLADHGLKIDTSTATDCSHLTRLPGFAHSKTGKPSEVLYLNPDSKFDWNFETNFWGCGLEGVSQITILPNKSNELVETVEEGSGIVSDVSGGSSLSSFSRSCFDIDSSELDKGPATQSVLESDNSVIPVNRTGKEGEERKTSKTNVIRFTPSGTFLDDLKAFENLKTNGIPSRHVRRELHRVMFTAARVYGMTEDQMGAAWRQIVEIHPENIGCSPDEAVQEVIAAFKAVGSYKRFLPNCEALPDLDDRRALVTRKWLIAQGCPFTGNVLKIIRRVLWDYARTLPIQCVRGQVGLKSSTLQRVCRANGSYGQALAWMATVNMVRLTDENYWIGRKSRRYFINIPLLLHVAGFESAELDWSKGSKAAAWMELGYELRVAS